MFFYNPKENKLICQTDDEKRSIVAWADKSFMIHLRVFKMEQLRDYFDRLSTTHSKIIYDPEQQRSWVEYEGDSGITCKELEDYIRSYDWTSEQQYVIVYKRPLAGFKSFSLPKSVAYDQYMGIKGMSISKIIANAENGVVESAQGNEGEKCIDHFRSLMAAQQQDT